MNAKNFYKEFGKIDVAAFIDTIQDNKEALEVVGEISAMDLKADITKEDLKDYAKVIQEGNYLDAVEKLKEELSKADSLEEKVKLSEEIRKLRVRRMKDVE